MVTDLSELDDDKEIVKDNNTKKEIDFGFLDKGAELFEMWYGSKLNNSMKEPDFLVEISTNFPL